MAAKLFTFPGNPLSHKIQIAAAYSGVAIELAGYQHGVTNKSAEFLQKFPLGKVPALLTADGQPIYESDAIASYVAGASTVLQGRDAYEKALVQQFVSLAQSDLYEAACTWVYPTLGYIQYNKAATEKAKAQVKTILGMLNDILAHKTFLVTERVTLADIALATALVPLYQQVLDPSFRGSFPNTNRWFVTCVNQPEFKNVLGSVTLAEKMAQFDNKAYAELQAKLGKGGKGKEKNNKKEKKEQPKKEAKKEKPKKEEAAEEEPKPKKAKDPLAELPKGSLDMDEFKRCYSNEDTPIAIDHFWKHFDKENYSIWLGTYKYNDELTKVFMTCNLVGGMFQRLEKLKKYAFASACVFGEDGNNAISGLWIWRGHENVFDLNEDWNIDAPSYEWKKLDPDSEETKTYVKEYFMWEGKFENMGGLEFNQGKIFK